LVLAIEEYLTAPVMQLIKNKILEIINKRAAIMTKKLLKKGEIKKKKTEAT